MVRRPIKSSNPGTQSLNSCDSIVKEDWRRTGRHKIEIFQESLACVASLKNSAKNKDLQKGVNVHARVVRRSFLCKNCFVTSALINMYAKCGAFSQAAELLEGVAVRDWVSWSALISGYAQAGHGREALSCFERMQSEGLSPNAITLASLLRACGSIRALDKGEKLHSEICRRGLLSGHTALGGALVDMYAKCGSLVKAKQVLEGLPVRSVVSWSALIAGYAQKGNGKAALECFELMERDGHSANAFTFASILKACGKIGALSVGKKVHFEIVKQGLSGEMVLGGALVDMYAKCGALTKAKEVLESLPIRNAISWSAMISGYAQHEHNEDALNCYEWMQSEGLSPDAVTFVCLLRVCGSAGALDIGENIHHAIVRLRLGSQTVPLGNALVDMYAKCGSLTKAKSVLDEIPVRTVVCWSALMAGYAQRCDGKEALKCFEQMQLEGLLPDEISFLSVLTACCRSTFLHEGQKYFEQLTSEYDNIPWLEHQTCMVDLFGRAGLLDKAAAVIKKMPPFSHPPVWAALLAACKKWGSIKLGRWAFKQYAIDSNGEGFAPGQYL